MIGASWHDDPADGAGALTAANANSRDMGGNVYQQPGEDLKVNVTAIKFLNRTGAAPVVTSYAGVTGQAVTANKTTVFWLTAAGALASAVSPSTYPNPEDTDHIRLATVVTDATEISSITDDRPKVTLLGKTPVATTYAVAALPSAAIAGQVIFVSDETSGAVLAFSDGANWRRVTDRVIVS